MSFDMKVINGDQTLLDTKYPTWKCDTRPTPRHFGIVKVSINGSYSVSGDTINVLNVDHNYGYKPSFLVVWNYPTGTNPGGLDNKTFGVGVLSNISGNVGTGYSADEKSFKINMIVAGSVTDYVELRYYIFANDFPRMFSTSDFFHQ